jgi:hypothetical protein
MQPNHLSTTAHNTSQACFEEFQHWTMFSSHSSIKIDDDTSSIKQSNTRNHAAKLEAMLHNDEVLEVKFPPLTPPKRDMKCPTQQKKPSKEIESDSDSNTSPSATNHQKEEVSPHHAR